jgi:hypothetical protein
VAEAIGLQLITGITLGIGFAIGSAFIEKARAWYNAYVERRTRKQIQSRLDQRYKLKWPLRLDD